MFEFEDSKLGKLKVINITEARANIASIVDDEEFNYVITKNNKPLRAIINYGDFKKSSLTKNIRSTPPPKNQVKGLIESRTADIKASEEIMPEASEPKQQKQVVNAPNSYFEDLSHDDDEQAEYFSKYRKLYETQATPSIHENNENKFPNNQQVSPPTKTYQPPPRPQTELPKPQPSRMTHDPPSIQDLLKDLENEKLSGEEEEL